MYQSLLVLMKGNDDELAVTVPIQTKGGIQAFSLVCPTNSELSKNEAYVVSVKIQWLQFTEKPLLPLSLIESIIVGDFIVFYHSILFHNYIA